MARKRTAHTQHVGRHHRLPVNPKVAARLLNLMPRPPLAPKTKPKP